MKLNQQQKESLAQYGINAVKNNMTKENLKSAGQFAAKNTKLVGSMAMQAFSQMTLSEKKPEPPKKKDNDDFFSNFA